MRRNFTLIAALLFLPLVGIASQLETYALTWSGSAFENTASATGLLTLDLGLVPNPQQDSSFDIFSAIVDLSVTVTGASSGNGTWTKSDLAPNSALGTYTYWGTAGTTLDMNTQLVGQAGGWGTPDGSHGDFNLFFTNGGPLGTYYFTLTTNGGAGDSMLLTSFAPTSSAPEPASLLLLGTGLAGLAMLLRRRRA